MKITLVSTNSLNPAEYNPRQITNKQYLDLKSSMEKFGCVDPIIININPERLNVVVGGHQRLRILRELGAEKVPTVSVNLSEEDERELNVRLNKSGGDWDIDILANEFDVVDLKEWGFKDVELGFNIDKIEDDSYTKKINTPIYEPKGIKPKVSELYNEDKGFELLEKIRKSKVSKAEKEFLTIASFRHVVFDYSKIAEYYAQSNKEMQELMEDSALVIIDFKKAIEDGYVKLAEQISNEYNEEYGK